MLLTLKRYFCIVKKTTEINYSQPNEELRERERERVHYYSENQAPVMGQILLFLPHLR